MPRTIAALILLSLAGCASGDPDFGPTLSYSGIRDPLEREFAADVVNRARRVLFDDAATPEAKVHAVEAVAWCVDLMDTEDRDQAWRYMNNAWRQAGHRSALPWATSSNSPEPVGHCRHPGLPAD